VHNAKPYHILIIHPAAITHVTGVGDNSDSYYVTEEDWLVSAVRHKNPNIKGISDIAGHSGGHVWLLVTGLDENNFTFFREIHFYLNTDLNPDGLLIQTGVGLISVRDRVPDDLFAQLKANLYEAKSCMFVKYKVEELFANVEVDRINNLGYMNTGRSLSFFSEPSLSCLTFCEKYLKKIGFSILSDKEKPWYDFMLALPNQYLPTFKIQCLILKQ
jgi:hypothetical protein